ncbi:MAG: glycosyltransferase family 4 protein [Methylicorpusculum sp.]|uniref:glycosyltransferase family 4 protein n=1 Tax=Methylicorpusculum sp. TaxID=2713644 RepID=UPI002726270F|nr:glycosyltransferase family 4 protein [Methylicorpusculum sp.]MDO8940070.1 glycosyltransferase family 4 protein [Methylicorpusculum sp.]MDP2201451.1 glycosyltransferase family 4 protein [Methylicorpusculum sp.]
MSNKQLTVIQVLPALNGGGVEKGTLEIGRFLAQQGHRSIVVSAGGRMVQQLIDEGSDHIQADIGAKKLSTLRYISWFRRMMLDIRPDIVHLRSRLPAWICYLAWKSLPKKDRPHLVSTFHSHHSVNRYSEIMACGERVIAVSNMMKNYIINAYPNVDPNKIRVIHRGVDTQKFTPEYRPSKEWLQAWYAEFPETAGKALITIPGRLTRKKGHEDFIKIMVRLIDLALPVHGLIVGDTDPKKNYYRDELEKSIAGAGLSKNITFTGHRNDLENIMSISSIVLTIKTEPEAFGRTTAEALSLGIPVIGYAIGGVQEQMAELFQDGLVEVGDIETATGKIQDFLSNRPVIKSNSLFTLDNMCKDTYSVYEELINPSESQKI